MDQEDVEGEKHVIHPKSCSISQCCFVRLQLSQKLPRQRRFEKRHPTPSYTQHYVGVGAGSDVLNPGEDLAHLQLLNTAAHRVRAVDRHSYILTRPRSVCHLLQEFVQAQVRV